MVICTPSGIAIYLHHMTIDGATEVSLQFCIVYYKATTFCSKVRYPKRGFENLTVDKFILFLSQSEVGTTHGISTGYDH